MVKIIHIHGFKCAGTTFEKTLLREFDDLLLIESKDSGRRLLFEEIPRNLLHLSSISSHLLSPFYESDALQIALIRDPYKRLVSAWKFTRKVENTNEKLKDFIGNYKNSMISNYQSKLLSVQTKSDLFNRGWNINLDLDFLFSKDFFVGLVERYDESMVIIEHRMKQRDVIVDLSYPQKANTTSNILPKKKIPDLRRFAYPSIDCDQWIWDLTNSKIDEEIKGIKSFDKKLQNFHERCKESKFIKKERSPIKI